MSCLICGNLVTDEEWAKVLAKYPTHTFSPGVIVCAECAAEMDDGFNEVEKRHAQQAMIEEALHFIADYGAEAWNEIIEAVQEQAK